MNWTFWRKCHVTTDVIQPSDSGTVSAVGRRCAATGKDGKQCRGWATVASGGTYCAGHDVPRRDEALRQATVKSAEVRRERVDTRRQLMRDVREEVERELAWEVLEVFRDALFHPDPKVKMQAGKELWDRFEGRPTAKLEQTVETRTAATMTDEERREAITRVEALLIRSEN